MPLVHYADAAGKKITLQRYGEEGQYLAARVFPQDVLENIPNLSILEDDVLICSYPKTGCHWLWEMARMLREGTTKVEVTEKERWMLEISPDSDLSGLPPRRVLNTHVYFRQLPSAVRDGKVKLLFIYRNPKDVAVSLYHHICKIPSFEYSGRFGDYLTELFLKGRVESGSYFDYLKDWEKVMDDNPDLPVFLMSYEELQADGFSKLKELAKFLGSTADEDTIRDIVDKCSFGQMLDRKGSHWVEMFGVPLMYRKGKVGDWKNSFTVAHSEMMDKVIEKEMKGSRFRFQYTL